MSWTKILCNFCVLPIEFSFVFVFSMPFPLHSSRRLHFLCDFIYNCSFRWNSLPSSSRSSFSVPSENIVVDIFGIVVVSTTNCTASNVIALFMFVEQWNDVIGQRKLNRLEHDGSFRKWLCFRMCRVFLPLFSFTPKCTWQQSSDDVDSGKPASLDILCDRRHHRRCLCHLSIVVYIHTTEHLSPPNRVHACAQDAERWVNDFQFFFLSPFLFLFSFTVQFAQPFFCRFLLCEKKSLLDSEDCLFRNIFIRVKAFSLSLASFSVAFSTIFFFWAMNRWAVIVSQIADNRFQTADLVLVTLDSSCSFVCSLTWKLRETKLLLFTFNSIDITSWAFFQFDYKIKATFS